MIERKEFYGYWWIPDNEQKKVPGLFVQDPNLGIHLFLFEKLIDVVSSKSFYSELICGKSTDGIEMTLYQNYMGATDNQRLTNLNKKFESKYAANYLFIGTNFKTSSDLSFDSLSVSFSNLEKWVDFTGFNMEFFKDKGYDAEIKYISPNPLTLAKKLVL